MKGLLLDFGGVLTTNVFDSFRDFCVAEGLEPDAVKRLFRDEPRARELVRGLERGELSEDAVRRALRRAARDRGPHRPRGPHVRRAAGRTSAMLAAVRRARAAGIRTGLDLELDGSGPLRPRDIPGAVRRRGHLRATWACTSPQPEIFLLGAERAGLPPEECVFVDDLRENCDGAEAVGMTAVLHRGADTTVPELERLLGVELR